MKQSKNVEQLRQVSEFAKIAVFVDLVALSVNAETNKNVGIHQAIEFALLDKIAVMFRSLEKNAEMNL